MPPKRQKQQQKRKLQDLPISVRKSIVEFLQPTYRQQDELKQRYFDWQSETAFRKLIQGTAWEEADVPGELEQRNKDEYQKLFQRYTKAPGIYDTYQYFWDDEYPWPDQNGGGGSGRPITS